MARLSNRLRYFINKNISEDLIQPTLSEPRSVPTQKDLLPCSITTQALRHKREGLLNSWIAFLQ